MTSIGCSCFLRCFGQKGDKATEEITAFVQRSAKEYSEAVQVYEREKVLRLKDPGRDHHFFGSNFGVSIINEKGVISLEAPMMVASGVVNLIAKKIFLGAKGRGAHEHPLRLYAPLALTMTAEEIFFGDVEVLQYPPEESCAILCTKQLAFVQTAQATRHAFNGFVRYMTNVSISMPTVNPEQLDYST